MPWRGQRGTINQICTRANKVGGNNDYSARIDSPGTGHCAGGIYLKLFDMHCDTLYRAYTENSNLYNDDFHISFNKTDGISTYIQCLAVWIPDEYRGKAAGELFDGCVSLLQRQTQDGNILWCTNSDDIKRADRENKKAVLLTVESGACLQGNIGNIKRLADIGVKMMTLTWNGTNELGDGVGVTENNRGLSDFGRKCIKELEKHNIIVDVSHLGERGFYEVAELSEKPFAASHSNAVAVCPHRRNLTNEQIDIIVQKKGIIGLNFCAEFLNKDKTNAKMYDIIRVADHFLSKGAEKVLAMGADFDGAEIPRDMKGLESMTTLYEAFIQEFSQKTADDVFFENAYRFFTENLL